MSGDFSSRFNGSFLCPSQRTGQKNAAPDKCPVPSPRARPSKQRARHHRTKRTGQNFPVRCSVRCSLNSAPWLGLATGQTGRVTGHVRCTPGTFVRCTTLLCLARANSNREHPSTGQKPPDRTLLSGALSGASPRQVSTCFLNALSSYLPTTMCISNVHVC